MLIESVQVVLGLFKMPTDIPILTEALYLHCHNSTTLEPLWYRVGTYKLCQQNVCPSAQPALQLHCGTLLPSCLCSNAVRRLEHSAASALVPPGIWHTSYCSQRTHRHSPRTATGPGQLQLYPVTHTLLAVASPSPSCGLSKFRCDTFKSVTFDTFMN